MSSILKVNTIQDTDGNNIINENANVITIGASGDTITVPAGATVSGFTSAGIDDNATSTAITISSDEDVTFTEDILLGDSKKAIFGAGSDLEIFHNGTNSIIENKTGDLILRTPDAESIFLRDAGGNNLAQFNDNSGVNLYHNASVKIATTSTGATVTGDLTATGDISTGNNGVLNILDGDGDISGKLANQSSSAHSLEIIADPSNSGANSNMMFKIDNSEKVRIDSSGNVLVGKTSDGSALSSVGINLRPTANSTFTADGNQALQIGRLTSDGLMQGFYKDGTIVGSIGIVNSNNLFIQGDSTNSGLQCGTNTILPVQSGANASNTIDMGDASNLWKDIYLGGGLYLGGTGSANKLDDYEEGLHEASLTPSASGSVNLGGNENTLSYVKIGHLVNVQGSLAVNTLSSPTGYIKISMPFTAASLTENADKSAASLMFNNVNTATVGDFVGIVETGTSELRIYLGDNTYANEDSAQQLRSGTSIYLNVSYRTT